MSSYEQHPFYQAIFQENYNYYVLRLRFAGILLLCIALIIYINVSLLKLQEKKFNNCIPSPLIKSTASHLRKSRGPPYLAYIISSTQRRFNFTLVNLNTVLPNYFNIKQKQSVSHNDSRIFRNSDPQVSSLLLTYIDLWSDFGARSEAEFTDNDWMFLFEDDVNIVHPKIIESFHPQIYAKWNYSNPNSSIAGSKGLFMMGHTWEFTRRLVKKLAQTFSQNK